MSIRRHLIPGLVQLLVLPLGLLPAPTPAGEQQPFRIEIVDQSTGRGVPLVELRTVNEVLFVSDSAGRVAITDPDLLGHEVFFHVFSHGYEFPADGFGYRGRRLSCVPGGSARLELPRINLAERLYRVTGGGIYRDSVLLGETPPLVHPLLNTQVLGQDSVLQAQFRGRLYWFWGDTQRPGHPLGNFHVPGATTPLPGPGGLDPMRGIDFDYFPGPDGFAKPTATLPGSGPTWLEGLTVARDSSGRERLFAAAMKIKPPLEVSQRRFVEWEDDAREWRAGTDIPLTAPLYPTGHPFEVRIGDTDFRYFATPLGLTRVPARAESLLDLGQYEAYTCLVDGSSLKAPQFDRNSAGEPRYRWRRDTPPLAALEQSKLVGQGQLRPHDGLVQLRDVESGQPVLVHGGTTAWNSWRRRWILVAVQWGGTSNLGEVWYSEAESPLGPWAWARKIVTHQRYSFYNPRHHPLFDDQGGRRIYFEGTYTATFSGNSNATPRYDYNQIMYRLDLDHPGLAVPVAVGPRSVDAPRAVTLGELRPRSWYRVDSSPGETGESLPQVWRTVPFFAPDQPGTHLVPVVLRKQADGEEKWEIKPELSDTAQPCFYVWQGAANPPPKSTVELWQSRNPRGQWVWELRPSAETTAPPAGNQEEYLGRVWPNPWQSPQAAQSEQIPAP